MNLFKNYMINHDQSWSVNVIFSNYQWSESSDTVGIHFSLGAHQNPPPPPPPRKKKLSTMFFLSHFVSEGSDSTREHQKPLELPGPLIWICFFYDLFFFLHAWCAMRAHSHLHPPPPVRPHPHMKILGLPMSIRQR